MFDILGFLDDRRATYAASWTTTYAAAFEAGGHYGWMADAIPVSEYPRILEVGTGDGRPAALLLSRGHDLVSIDENIGCLWTASERLTSEGFEPCLLDRVEGRRIVGDHYQEAFRTVDLVGLRTLRAVLVEGNILIDVGLHDALAAAGPFDAITCWLMGTHEAVHRNAYLRNIKTDELNYRIQVQRTLCELAGRLLRPGGILHFVDRGVRSDDEAADILTEDYGKRAEGTQLRLEELAFRHYVEIDPGDGIRMRVAPGAPTPQTADRFLISAKLRKP